MGPLLADSHTVLTAPTPTAAAHAHTHVEAECCCVISPVVAFCQLLQLVLELLLLLQGCGLILLQVEQLPEEVVDALLGLQMDATTSSKTAAEQVWWAAWRYACS